MYSELLVGSIGVKISYHLNLILPYPALSDKEWDMKLGNWPDENSFPK